MDFPVNFARYWPTESVLVTGRYASTISGIAVATLTLHFSIQRWKVKLQLGKIDDCKTALNCFIIRYWTQNAISFPQRVLLRAGTNSLLICLENFTFIQFRGTPSNAPANPVLPDAIRRRICSARDHQISQFKLYQQWLWPTKRWIKFVKSVNEKSF